MLDSRSLVEKNNLIKQVFIYLAHNSDLFFAWAIENIRCLRDLKPSINHRVLRPDRFISGSVLTASRANTLSTPLRA